MADPVTATAATADASSDPISSAIESSIAELPGSDAAEAAVDTSAGNVDTTAQVSTDPSAAAATVAEQLSEIDKLIEAEMGAGHTKKRDNRIPHSRTVKIIEKAKAAWEKAVTDRLGTEHQTAIKGHTDKIAAFEEQVRNIDNVNRLIESSPEAFLSALVDAYPQYKAHIGGAKAPQGEPQPDVELTDGRRTYSPEQAAKLAAWQAEQAIARHLEPERQARQRAAAAEHIDRQAQAEVKRQVDSVSKLPLYKESETEIKKALADNPAANLFEAYAIAVLPKIMADRTKMREELIAELNAKPRATATSTAPAAPTKAAGEGRTLEEIIADSIKGLR